MAISQLKSQQIYTTIFHSVTNSGEWLWIILLRMANLKAINSNSFTRAPIRWQGQNNWYLAFVLPFCGGTVKMCASCVPLDSTCHSSNHHEPDDSIHTAIFYAKRVIFNTFEHVKVTSGCVRVALLVVHWKNNFRVIFEIITRCHLNSIIPF